LNPNENDKNNQDSLFDTLHTDYKK